MAASTLVLLPCVDALANTKFEREHGSIGSLTAAAGPVRKASSVVRRAAFDIGSGTTKLLVVDVDLESNRCLRQLLAREVPVLYGIDARQTASGSLSQKVQDEGLSVLRTLLTEAAALRAESAVGVATEVFRRASNGPAFVERIRNELSLAVRVVDQSVEALLGFRTACALSAIPQWELVMWDCGGGSFQLVAAPEGLDGPLQMHLGALGDAVATAMLVELQGRSFTAAQSPNPVQLSEAQELTTRLVQRLPSTPAWLRDSEGVVAIGGRNSMFFLLADMMLKGLVAVDGCKVEADDEGYPESCTITATIAHLAIEAVAGCLEGELSARWCWRPNSDPPSMVVPKLCLIAASMEGFGLRTCRWRRTVGNCPGLATAHAAELGVLVAQS